MKLSYLLSGLVACAILVAALFGGVAYTESVEAQYVHALAPAHAPLNVTGSALQKVAFRQPDLLPIYGASEVVVQWSSYQSSQLFENYPTGFETFEVEKGGAASLITAQQMAAIGPDLRGKKVVVSFAPADFTLKAVGSDAYAASFSRLHANELVFSDLISYSTKQAAARRMLQYPATLDKDPILRFALQNLADDSLFSYLLYEAAWPLGKVQTWIMELQDQYETITYINSQIQDKKLKPDVKRQPQKIDWKALVAKATTDQMPHSDNNPYGFDNTIWLDKFGGTFKPRPNGAGNDVYLNDLENSQEWVDFDIMLRVLKDMGAQPLLLGRPIKANYLVDTGVSLSVQQLYYARVSRFAKEYGFAVANFRDHQNDKYFGVDPVPHTSRIGWVYVDQVLDEFYHDNLH